MFFAAGECSAIKSSHLGNHTEGETPATAVNLSEVYADHNANSPAREYPPRMTGIFSFKEYRFIISGMSVSSRYASVSPA